MNGWSKPGGWIPYAAEVLVDIIGWPEEEIRAKFGDVVLVRQTRSGLQFAAGPPSPAQMRARVSAILAEAMK